MSRRALLMFAAVRRSSRLRAARPIALPRSWCRAPPTSASSKSAVPVRGFHLPDAVPVRRALGRSRHAAQCARAACAPAPAREAWGFGSMTLGNAWAFPAASQDDGLGAMRALAGRRCATVTAACDEQRASDRSLPRARAGYLRARRTLSRARSAAGRRSRNSARSSSRARSTRRSTTRTARRSGVSCYETYGPRFMTPRPVARSRSDSSRASTSIATCRRAPRRPMPVFHSVGRKRSARGRRRRDADRRRPARTRSRSGSRATA